MHDPSFRLQADVSLLGPAVATLSHEFSVHFEGDVSIEARNPVMVPFGTWVRAVFDWKRTTAAPPIDRSHFRAVDRKDVAVCGVTPRVSVVIF